MNYIILKINLFTIIFIVSFFNFGCKNQKIDSSLQRKTFDKEVESLVIANVTDEKILKVIKNRKADFVVPVNYYELNKGIYVIWVIENRKIIRIHLIDDQGGYKLQKAEIMDKYFRLFPGTPSI